MCVSLISLLALYPSVTYGAPEGNDWGYASPGQQYAEWSKSNRRIKFLIYAQSSMSTDRCLDGMLDWKTSNGTHYDARVVRTCMPGGEAITGTADGYWNEPSDWGGRTITDMQKGVAARIDDDYVGGNFQMYSAENFSGAGGGAYTDRPRACTDKFARTRVRYQDGHYNSCDSNSVPTSPSS